jgi:hypothetical protein
MRVLSAQEADSLGLNDEAPKGQRILSPEEAKSLGLDDDGPRPDLFKAASDAMPAATDTILSGARGLLDMVPFSHRFIAGVQGEPVEAVDQRYEATKEEHPAAFRTGQVASLLLPGPKGIKGLAALGGLQAAGDSRGGFSDAVKDAGFGAVLGGTLGLAGKGVAAAAGLGAKALPFLRTAGGEVRRHRRGQGRQGRGGRPPTARWAATAARARTRIASWTSWRSRAAMPGPTLPRKRS